MNLTDFVNRPSVPVPWSEGDNIPWNDPEFSERMLKEHLNQEHDAASRRTQKIDRQVNWIHMHVLGGQHTAILDLGCGPGLYTERLALLGHVCTGIDFSPASIRYAREQARLSGTHCTYICDDIRSADYGGGFGLVMQIFGEINVFNPQSVRRILRKAWQALSRSGVLLIEPSTFAGIRYIGRRPPTWHSSQAGLFSAQPHIKLEEHYWDEPSRTSTTRHFIIDTATAEVTCSAATYQAYTADEYVKLLQECGYEEVQLYPSLIGQIDESQSDFMAIVARRPA